MMKKLLKQKLTLAGFTLFIILVLAIVFLSPEKTYAFEGVAQVLKNPQNGLTLKVVGVWNGLIRIEDVIVVAILIAVAFVQILRLNVNTYGVKKVLPTLVMAIIAAHFSMLICRLVIDMGNVVLKILISDFGREQYTFAVNPLLEPVRQIAAQKNFDLHTTLGILWYIAAQLLLMAGAIMIIILAFLFIVRNWLMYILTALSPVAFMAMAFPQSKSMFNQWWSNLVKWTFMPVVSVFWLWLGGQWAGAISGYNGSSYFLNFLFFGVCFYLAITTPFKMGGPIMQKWGGLGKQAWGATGGKAVSWAGREAKERANDARIRAGMYLQKGNRIGRALDASVGERIRKNRQTMIGNREERLMRAQGAKLAYDKMVDNGKADAAYKLANDPRIGDSVRSRYKALVRSKVADEAKSYENFDLVKLLEKLQFNPDESLVTSENNQGVIDPSMKFSESGGMMDQLAVVEQIKRMLRRPNSLTDQEKTIARDIIERRQFTINGATKQLFATTTREAYEDFRRLDTNGFGGMATGPFVGDDLSVQAIGREASPEVVRAALGGDEIESIQEHIKDLSPEEQAAAKGAFEKIKERRQSILEDIDSSIEAHLDEVRDGLYKMRGSETALAHINNGTMDSRLQASLEALQSGHDPGKVKDAIAFAEELSPSVLGLKESEAMEVLKQSQKALDFAGKNGIEIDASLNVKDKMQEARAKLSEEARTFAGAKVGTEIAAGRIASDPRSQIRADQGYNSSHAIEMLSEQVENLAQAQHNASGQGLSKEALKEMSKGVARSAFRDAVNGMSGLDLGKINMASLFKDERFVNKLASKIGTATGAAMAKTMPSVISKAPAAQAPAATTPQPPAQPQPSPTTTSATTQNPTSPTSTETTRQHQ